MTDELIARLSANLNRVPPQALQNRLWIAVGLGLSAALLLAYPVLHLLLDRPMGATWGGMMFWVKAGYTIAFGLLGCAALPVLARPDGRILWPMASAAILLLASLTLGTMSWMTTDWSMSELMGATSMVCPWLIVLTSTPILAAMLVALRAMAPRSSTMAGFAAGLLAGGFGAAIYSFYCGETGMMFMAVWYSLGVAATAALGALLGRPLLRW